MLNCGHSPSPHNEYTTGTAHTEDDREICWECANKEHVANLKIIGIVARDAYGYYGLVAGSNGITVADMLAMVLSGRTLSRNPIIAAFTSESALCDYLRHVGARP